MIIVNGWKPLTIITKRSILDVAAVLDPSLKPSFLISQKLCRMKHESVHCGKLSNLISISRLNDPNLALRQPNAHSITILADDKRYQKIFRVDLYPHLQILSLNMEIVGTQDHPKCIWVLLAGHLL